MEKDHSIATTHTRKKNLFALYIASFLFGTALALPTYINSTFLSELVPETWVGVAYALGSILTLIALPFLPGALRAYGNYRAMLALLAVLTVATVLLGFSREPFFVIPVFVIYLAIFSVALLSLDIFIENYSTDADTGKIRGTTLTIANGAFILSPLVAGFLLTNGDYWKIYSLAGLCTLVLWWLIASRFSNFKDPIYEKSDIIKTFREVRARKDIWRIFMANVILRFFFAWMVIYTPIYLHEHIGFSWNEIGGIFAIMLLPFVLFELPAGRLADARWGEKEILIAGFLIMSMSTAILSFLSAPVFALWAGVLFMTRVGASLVDITTESYFFKQIGGKDANIAGFFRNANPVAYLAGPLVAGICLSFIDFSLLFLTLSAIILVGILYALRITDTK